MQSLRDDPTCAREEHQARCDENDPGISLRLSFDPNQDLAAPFVGRGARPRVAILREQGVNGQIEMAAAFHRAGFEAVDVHMSDILKRAVWTWTRSADSRLAVASPTATYWARAKAGPSRSCSTPEHARSSSASLPGPTPSPSGCATDVRRFPT